MKQYKQIVTPNFYIYNAELEKLKDAGWSIDWENSPPIHTFTHYECNLVREYDEENPPKMTPAEKMEKARAARAAKAAEKAND